MLKQSYLNKDTQDLQTTNLEIKAYHKEFGGNNVNAKSTLFIAAASIAMFGAGAAAAQTAQSSVSKTPAAEAKSGQIEEVVVTARRQVESLQNVPVAVSAFSAKELATHNVTSMADLSQLTPSLGFTQSNWGPLGVDVEIRGQRASDIILGATPSVGVYVDDIYQSSAMALKAISMADVSSVEVLKGPQGTLYGRNTTGGAIKVITQLPSYDVASGVMRVGAGNENERRASGLVSVPLVDGKVALGLSANYDQNDGYGRDIANHQNLGDTDIRSISAVLRMRPIDRLEIVARANQIDADSGGNFATLTLAVPGSVLNQVAALGLGLPLTPEGLAAANVIEQAKYVNQTGTDRAYSLPTFQHVLQSTYSVALQYDLTDQIQLKSITGYQRFKSLVQGDLDASPFHTTEGPFDQQYYNQYTEEVQLAGKFLQDRLNFTAGYFYYKLHGQEPQTAFIETGLLNLTYLGFVDVRNESNSGYAQASFAIIPTLRLTGGIRYTEESNGLNSTNQLSFPGRLICNIPTALLTPGAGCLGEFLTKSHNVSYTAGVDWNYTDNVLLYAKTSKGFKSGGINTATPFLFFQPEEVTDYEIGVKSEMWDHRVRLNLAGYYQNYDNIQRKVLVHVNGVPQGGIQNAAAARIDGLEAELTVRPTSNLTLNASGSYTHAKYLRYVDPASGTDLSGHVFAAVPEWQGALSATYEHPVPVGLVSATLDLSYQSSVNYDPENNQPPSAAFPQGTAQYSSQKGYALLNGHVDLNLTAYDAKISLWARNLTNKRYFAGGEDQSVGNGFVYMEIGQPRTYGVEITKHF